MTAMQVAVGGNVFSYERFGDGKGKKVLILHGWGRSKEEWLPIARQLALGGKKTVYVLDLPGFGGSTLPSKLRDIGEYAGIVAGFCQYLREDELVIVGHSLGGRVGIIMSSEKPALEVQKLVLMDPAGIKDFSVKRLSLQLLSKLFAFVPEEIRRKVVRVAMDEDYQQAGEKQNLYRAVVGRDLTKSLAHITCPVVLMWGDEDSIVSFKQIKVYRRKVKDLLVRVIWGAGHDPHLTNQEAVMQVLREEL